MTIDDIRTLRDLVAAQQAVLEEQAARIAALEAHALRGIPAPVSPHGEATATRSLADRAATVTDDAAEDGSALRTDRRGMLRTVGAAAAGVATGAVVLGQAAPAAAAISDTGNPAVLGTASPNTGIGVRGESLTGIGVQGRSQAAVGPAVGVEGFVAGTNSTGVHGVATNATSATAGVFGESFSTAGLGVRGLATASSGSTVGVRGDVESSAGVGTLGNNASTTGDAVGVAGLTSSPTGIAVFGNALGASGASTGVHGTSSTPGGTGVWGLAAAAGVHGQSTNGYGVLATSQRSQLRLVGTPTPPTTAGVARSVGEICFDSSEDLWVCVASGTPGTWRRFGGASTAGSLALLPVPVRIYDSRAGFVPATGPKAKIADGEIRVIDTKGNSSGVPAGATGVLVTLTVVNGSANGGFLALYAAGQATPASSTINWSGGGAVATTTITAVSATATVAVYCAPNSSTDLLLDVIGYYR